MQIRIKEKGKEATKGVGSGKDQMFSLMGFIDVTTTLRSPLTLSSHPGTNSTRFGLAGSAGGLACCASQMQPSGFKSGPA